MSGRPINFYFLSSGFCGTRYYHHALRAATNAEVWHQPGHEDIAEITDEMERRFDRGPEVLLRADISEFPFLKRRIDKRLSLPWVYGDTLNWMRGVGWMLYRYVGPERLRLVELVRHPVATCRSVLADARQSAGDGFSDLRLAEETARRWVRQYGCIRHQMRSIDDPRVCRTVRLEDANGDQIRELYSFLGLEGFDAATVAELTANTSRDARNSHRQHSTYPASQEELKTIWRLCEPLAAQYGYSEDESLYHDAPSRPAGSRTGQQDSAVEGERPPTVKLFDHRGLGLIIKLPSGVEYVSHAGGPMCFWGRAQGTFVPLAEDGPDSPGRKLFDHFHLRRGKSFMSAISEPDADFIDGILAEHGLQSIRVTRSRIGETWDLFSWETWKGLFDAPWEAWVPVSVGPMPYGSTHGAWSGNTSMEGILVWENSN
jgi:hypothetical protein